MPLVTIILPVYNARVDHLETALLSLKAASTKDAEILIGLDGPCDDAINEAICRSSDHKGGPPVRVMNLPRKGISMTLNSLIDASDSRWIARQDSDDYSLPERIVRQVRQLEQVPKFGFCGTQIIRCDNTLRPLGVQWCHPCSFKGQLTYASLLNNPIAHPTLVINRESLGETRYKDIPGMEDWQLYIDLWERRLPSLNLDSPGVLYRMHATQVTAGKRNWKMINSLKKASLKAACKHFPAMRSLRPVQNISNTLQISKHLIHLRSKL